MATSSESKSVDLLKVNKISTLRQVLTLALEDLRSTTEDEKMLKIDIVLELKHVLDATERDLQRIAGEPEKPTKAFFYQKPVTFETRYLSLSINRCVGFSEVPTLPILQTFSATCCDELVSIALQPKLVSLNLIDNRNLKHLPPNVDQVLDLAVSYSPKCVGEIPRICPHLDRLWLSNMGNLAFTALPKLTHLYLNTCRGITLPILPLVKDMTLVNVNLLELPTTPKLRSLYISRCEFIKTLPSLPQLEQLEMFQMPIRLLPELPTLKRFIASECDELIMVPPDIKHIDVTKCKCVPNTKKG